MDAEPGDQPRDQPLVLGFDRTSEAAIDVDRWADVARRTLDGEGVSIGRLDLIFVDEDEMAELNAGHMGQTGPTDVLAFPLDADDADHLSGPPAGDGPQAGSEEAIPVHLGDVVVCPDVARRQAPEHCGTVDAEFSLLVVHGVLHVLGHDHAEPAETEVMRRRERHYLGGLGFAHPEPS